MFIRASALLVPVLALPSLVAAAPEPIVQRGGVSCSNGQQQCCNSSMNSQDVTQSLIEALVGVLVQVPIVGPLVGFQCSPITVVGVGGGASCSQQALCCSDNNFNGLVNLGCVNLNL
ncbi:fungal hydrophobin-domain-containing protein [Scleroderma yunnanense]